MTMAGVSKPSAKLRHHVPRFERSRSKKRLRSGHPLAHADDVVVAQADLHRVAVALEHEPEKAHRLGGAMKPRLLRVEAEA